MEQSSYVEGGQILDDMVIAHEVIHSLKNSKKVGILIKLDLSKAFDKLSWAYIIWVLIVFVFQSSWINWVWALVATPFFSVMLNGSLSSTLKYLHEI